MKVLVTGFTPFEGEQINPSFEAVKLLPREIKGAKIIKDLLTTAFGQSLREIKVLIKKHNPDIIICVGQAGGRKGISVEKVAVNFAQTRGYDKEGVIKNDTIVKRGRTAYFSTLPLQEIVTALREKQIPAELSLSAGSFVCNYIMYHILRIAQRQKNKARRNESYKSVNLSGQNEGSRKIENFVGLNRGPHKIENFIGLFLAGFIHVPYTVQQVKDKPAVFSMELEEIAQALQIAIETTLSFMQKAV